MHDSNYIAFSIKKPQKQRCGDATFASEIMIAGEKAVLLIVADGVSRAPKDWLASKCIVDFTVEEIKKSNEALPGALKGAIEVADKRIRDGVENTFGMLTTLSVVLFAENQKKMFWVNVGDSRIYGLKNKDWYQLTVDDSTNVPYKENGKLKMHNGVPVIQFALSKAIGQNNSLNIEVYEIQDTEYSAYALASDGFYRLTNFKNYATALALSGNMKEEALQQQSDIASMIDDDASLAVIRLPATARINLREHVMDNSEVTTVPVGVWDILESELKDSIQHSDNEYLKVLLSWMKNHELYFSRPKMIEILELMIACRNPLINEMTMLIRKIKI